MEPHTSDLTCLLMVGSMVQAIVGGEVYARGVSSDDDEKEVSKILAAKYADNFEPGFPQGVIGNIAKAYQVVAFMRELSSVRCLQILW